MDEFHHCEEVKGTIISVWKEQFADQWELRQKMPQRSHTGTCKIPNHHADVGGSIVETFCFQHLGSFSQVVIGVCEVKHVGLIYIGCFFSILASPGFARLIFPILLVTCSESWVCYQCFGQWRFWFQRCGWLFTKVPAIPDAFPPRLLIIQHGFFGSVGCFFSKQFQFCTIFGSCLCVNFFGRSIFNFCSVLFKHLLSIQGFEPQHSYFWRLLCMLTYHLSGLYFFGCCNITCKIPPRQSLCR